jgi:hypothetical protein
MSKLLGGDVSTHVADALENKEVRDVVHEVVDSRVRSILSDRAGPPAAQEPSEEDRIFARAYMTRHKVGEGKSDDEFEEELEGYALICQRLRIKSGGCVNDAMVKRVVDGLEEEEKKLEGAAKACPAGCDCIMCKTARGVHSVVREPAKVPKAVIAAAVTGAQAVKDTLVSAPRLARAAVARVRSWVNDYTSSDFALMSTTVLATYVSWRFLTQRKFDRLQRRMVFLDDTGSRLTAELEKGGNARSWNATVVREQLKNTARELDSIRRILDPTLYGDLSEEFGDWLIAMLPQIPKIFASSAREDGRPVGFITQAVKGALLLRAMTSEGTATRKLLQAIGLYNVCKYDEVLDYRIPESWARRIPSQVDWVIEEGDDEEGEPVFNLRLDRVINDLMVLALLYTCTSDFRPSNSMLGFQLSRLTEDERKKVKLVEDKWGGKLADAAENPTVVGAVKAAVNVPVQAVKDAASFFRRKWSGEPNYYDMTEEEITALCRVTVKDQLEAKGDVPLAVVRGYKIYGDWNGNPAYYEFKGQPKAQPQKMTGAELAAHMGKIQDDYGIANLPTMGFRNVSQGADAEWKFHKNRMREQVDQQMQDAEYRAHEKAKEKSAKPQRGRDGGNDGDEDRGTDIGNKKKGKNFGRVTYYDEKKPEEQSGNVREKPDEMLEATDGENMVRRAETNGNPTTDDVRNIVEVITRWPDSFRSILKRPPGVPPAMEGLGDTEPNLADPAQLKKLQKQNAEMAKDLALVKQMLMEQKHDTPEEKYAATKKAVDQVVKPAKGKKPPLPAPTPAAPKTEAVSEPVLTMTPVLEALNGHCKVQLSWAKRCIPVYKDPECTIRSSYAGRLGGLLWLVWHEKPSQRYVKLQSGPMKLSALSWLPFARNHMWFADIRSCGMEEKFGGAAMWNMTDIPRNGDMVGLACPEGTTQAQVEQCEFDKISNVSDKIHGYLASTREGDCGAPVVHVSLQKEGRLAGVHVANKIFAEFPTNEELAACFPKAGVRVQ